MKYDWHISFGEIHPCTPRPCFRFVVALKGHENDKCTIGQMFGVHSTDAAVYSVEDAFGSPAICTVFFQFQQAALETWKLKTPIYMMFPITLRR